VDFVGNPANLTIAAAAKAADWAPDGEETPCAWSGACDVVNTEQFRTIRQLRLGKGPRLKRVPFKLPHGFADANADRRLSEQASPRCGDGHEYECDACGDTGRIAARTRNVH
jgi:hypothetical protein